MGGGGDQGTSFEKLLDHAPQTLVSLGIPPFWKTLQYFWTNLEDHFYNSGGSGPAIFPLGTKLNNNKKDIKQRIIQDAAKERHTDGQTGGQTGRKITR